LRKSLYFGKCKDERKTWLPLLEKSYAKIHDDYKTLDGGFPSEGNEVLTGGVTSILFMNDILDVEKLWKVEMQRVNKENLMSCIIMRADPSAESHGVLSRHA